MDFEARASARRVLDSYRPPVGRHDLAHDRQAEPAPAGIAGPAVVETGESLEDAGPVGAGDARAVVVHRQHDLSFGVGHRDGDSAAGMDIHIVVGVGYLLT